MDAIERLKSFIEQSQDIVVFTGAGISTESGISDFRSQGGIWQRFQPVMIQEFMTDEGKRELYWERKLALFEENKDAEPNSGHKAIVELERQGKLRALITQNIDGLHGRSGIVDQDIVEIHVNGVKATCLDCQSPMPLDEARSITERFGKAPTCRRCGF